MKERTFLRVWGIGLILQVILYVVSFSHLVNVVSSHMRYAGINTFGLDFAGVGFWYLISFFYDQKWPKWLRWPGYLFALSFVVGVVYVNIRSWVPA